MVTLTKNIRLTWIEYLLDFRTIFLYFQKISTIDLLALSLRRGSTFQWSLIEGGNLVNLCYLKLGNIILINHTTNLVLSRLKKMVRRTNIIPPNINIILHFILSSSGQRVNTNIGIYLNLISDYSLTGGVEASYII